ncbi:MAG: hypothetical protein RQ885_09140 [Desulfurococcales archaeon]|jgi:hypothetical protein|nr:hypothetical protein [Desulfurococcales archaeon]
MTWRNNPRRWRRPRVRKLSMLLYQSSGYRVKDGYGEIMGKDRRYDDYEMGRQG